MVLRRPIPFFALASLALIASPLAACSGDGAPGATPSDTAADGGTGDGAAPQPDARLDDARADGGAPSLPGPCGQGALECDGTCVDPKTDRNNCGACGAVCVLGCVDGVCGCAPDAAMCGAECVDLATDRFHCGTCDHSCAPDDCVDGHCAACPDGGACDACPYSWLEKCSGACVDPDVDVYNCGACGHVCPTGPGEIAGCSSGQCSAVAAIADGLDPASSPLELTLDGEYVYWTAPGGSILRAPKAGGARPTVVLDPPAGPDAGASLAVTSLRFTADAVVFVRPATGTIGRVAKDGSQHAAPVTLADGEAGAVSIALAGGAVYWGAATGVRFVALGGGTPATLVTQGLPVTFVAAADGAIDWYEPLVGLNGSGVYTMALSSPGAPTLVKLLGTRVIEAMDAAPGELVAHGRGPLGEPELYWLTGPRAGTGLYGVSGTTNIASDGTLTAWASLEEIQVEPLATNVSRVVSFDSSQKVAPTWVAVDGAHVFVGTTFTGRIVRAAL